jgi:putative ABC transport system permease protein
LGIGANTAIFSLVHGVLVRPLPYPDSGQLVMIYRTHPEKDRRTWASLADLEDWQRESRSLTHLAGWLSQSANLTGIGEPDRVRAAFVSANFFDMIGVQPEQGRGFRAGEDVPHAAKLVVLSYGTWSQKFGGTAALGSAIHLNGEPYTLVGVMPRGFEFPWDKIDVWMTSPHYPNYDRKRGGSFVGAFGRLKPSVTAAEAQAELTPIARRAATAYPESNSEWPATQVIGLHESVVQDLKPLILILWGAVGFVMLIACANLANLALSRVLTRQNELSVRRALGATAGQLVRHLLTESLLLSLGGWIAGSGLALLATRGLALGAERFLPAGMAVQVTWQVLTFAFALSIMSGVAFGVLPAWHIARNRSNPLVENGRSGEGRRRGWMRRGLMIAAVAVSVILVTGAGLLIASFRGISGIDPGFKPDHLLTLEYRMPKNRYPQPEQQAGFHRRVMEEVGRLPGVQSATVAMAMPFSGNGSFDAFEVDGQPAPAKGSEPRAQVNRADPRYFETMSLPLLEGRVFSENDQLGGQAVAVVSQSLARRFWPGESAIGRAVRLRVDGGEPRTHAIVGVVGDSKHNALEEQSKEKIYVAFRQHPHIFGALAVRTRGEPMSFAPAVRRAVWAVDKDQPMWKIQSMESMINRSISYRQVFAWVLSGFSVFALMLAALGIYSVLAYSTGQRTREIGVRMALGERSGSILRSVLWQGLRIAAIGVAVGLAGALTLSRTLEAFLFQIRATEPSTYIISALTLGLIAAIACAIPAWRASRIDPLRALRQD